MNDLMKVFLVVGGIFLVGAHPETLGNIVAGLFRELFGLAAALAGELHEAAGGGLVILTAVFGLMVMFGGAKGGKSGGKKK
jgi:hypothetical protein